MYLQDIYIHVILINYSFCFQLVNCIKVSCKCNIIIICLHPFPHIYNINITTFGFEYNVTNNRRPEHSGVGAEENMEPNRTQTMTIKN